MKHKYLALGLIFGSGIGLCFGIVTNSIEISLPLGAGAGLIFGKLFKKKH